MGSSYYMVKISIIVPVYNTEPYLEQCLDSIINQTLEDIEIICVNDGSTDNSLSILEEYASKDNRIKIINQENEGQGFARNNGLKSVNGEYVLFVDSDDWIELNTCEALYKKANELDLNMLFFCATRYIEDEDKYDYTFGDYNYSSLGGKFWNKIFSYKDLDENLIFRITVTAWSKLYNSDFLKKSDARFPDNFFEDNYFFYPLFLKAEKVSIVENQFYNRRIRDDSTTQSGGRAFMDSIIAANQIIDVFKDNGLFKQYRNQLLRKKFNSNISRFFGIDDSLKEEYWSKLKEDFKDYKKYYDEEKDSFYYIIVDFYNNLIKSKNYKEFIESESVDLKSRHDNIKEKYESLDKESNNKINALNEKNKDLEEEYEELEKENEQLNEEINELSKFKRDVLNSRSWRITKPFRREK